MEQHGCLTVSLLDYLVGHAGCMYLSDLRFLREWERVRLEREVEKIPPYAANVQEWNDALHYLTGAPPERTAEEARCTLMTLLVRKSKRK